MQDDLKFNNSLGDGLRSSPLKILKNNVLAPQEVTLCPVELQLKQLPECYMAEPLGPFSARRAGDFKKSLSPEFLMGAVLPSRPLSCCVSLSSSLVMLNLFRLPVDESTVAVSEFNTSFLTRLHVSNLQTFSFSCHCKPG